MQLTYLLFLKMAGGQLALIFGTAQNKFQNPARLRCVIVDLIDAENRSALGERRISSVSGASLAYY